MAGKKKLKPSTERHGHLLREEQGRIDGIASERGRLRDPDLRSMVRDISADFAGDVAYCFAARDARRGKVTLREATATLFGSYADFCASCGGLVEGFMVNGAVWREAADEDDYLCMSCVERRLGRALTYEDFRKTASTPLNVPWLEPSSPVKLFRIDFGRLDADRDACEGDSTADGQADAWERTHAIEKKLRLRRIEIHFPEIAYREITKPWTLDDVILVRVPEPTPRERSRGCVGHREIVRAPTGEGLLRRIDAAAPKPAGGEKYGLQFIRRRGSRLEYQLYDPRTSAALIA